ncbi:MAG: GatB/YqeY domain-containing protein, partial [Methanophagales archaeon]|nr:GatB/YqeY domain-containing protein [Methanophagales archaeon]
AIDEIGLRLDTGEIEQIIEHIVNSKKDFIREKGERAVGPLMGVAMKELRGKVDGELINRLVVEKVKRILENG